MVGVAVRLGSNSVHSPEIKCGAYWRLSQVGARVKGAEELNQSLASRGGGVDRLEIEDDRPNIRDVER